MDTRENSAADLTDLDIDAPPPPAVDRPSPLPLIIGILLTLAVTYFTLDYFKIDVKNDLAAPLAASTAPVDGAAGTVPAAQVPAAKP